MKKALPLIQLGLALILAFSFFLAGCTSTRVPVATRPPLYSQQKIVAVDHWDNIAIEVAERVRKVLLDRPDLIARPLYVRGPEGRAFTEVFTGLLHTELVSRGMQVSQTPEPGAVFLEYSVQLVNFDGSRTGFMPSVASLGIGAVNMVTGRYTTPSDREVVVTSRITHNNRYVMHLSNYYYINDDDWQLYLSNPSVSGPDADGVWSRYAKRRPAFGCPPANDAGRTPL